MKTLTKHIGRLALIAGLMLAQHASAAVLSVPYYAQRSFFIAPDTNNNVSQWCWAASSEMVLNTPLSASYPGTFFTQDDIAAYGSQGSNYWNYLYGSAAATANSPALKGIDMILKNFGQLNTKKFTRALTKDELQTEIDAGRPAIARLGWGSGGGHFVVLYGFDGTTVDINDPWPDTGPVLQTYTSFSSTSATAKYQGTTLFHWTHTLTLGASLDVCFLIDTTGSMSGTINSVRSSLVNISSNIFALFPEARIAVKDFKDNPVWSGDPYLDRVDAIFTTNRSVINSALNGLGASGGGDSPEAHWTTLMRTLSGTGIGTWRPNPTPRIIIIASDVGGHNPEPWAGGFSINNVIAKANTPGKEISIFGLAVGGSAIPDLSAVAAGTGGAAIVTDQASVPAAILDAINVVSKSTRHPQGVAATPRPKFTFEPGNVGMASVPKNYVIQILKSNVLTSDWDLYLQTAVSGDSFTPKTSLPLGDYRWRLGAQQPATTITSPVGNVLATVPAGLVFEDEYTQFKRTTAVLGEATMLSPTTSPSEVFTLLNGNIPAKLRKLAKVGRIPQTFTWDAGLFATSYILTIQVQNANGSWSVLKTVTAAPPVGNPFASPLSVSVLGIKSGFNYRWSIQALGGDTL